MRAGGKTYSEIRNVLNIPKSTLSNWLSEKFSGIFDRKAQLAHLAAIRPAALAVWKKHKEKNDELLRKKIEREIEKYPINRHGFLKSMLAVLYWA